MPDDLRFTMELKDEFSAVFNKVANSVNETVPKLRSNLGGLSKSLAVVGAGMAIGTAVYGAWTLFKNKIADVTKEAKALENTLGNILGSKGAARNVLNELAESDLSKVFKIKEIDEGYMNLANHGLKATRSQMEALGDLSANTGKNFDKTIDAIIKGGEGKLSGLQELGVNVVKNKNKKLGIDELTLSFRGQTETIQNNSQAIQDYIFRLGKMEGVQGSMARSFTTVAAAENSMENQLAKLWGTLGEKFNPAVVESKGLMSKWVGTINEWLEIPVEKKITDEIVKIRGLQTELTSANTTEEKRKAILEQLHELNPKITDGINAEALSFEKLAQNIDAVTNALTKKITLSQLEKRYAKPLSEQASALTLKAEATSAINQAIYAIDPELAKRTDLSFGQKQMLAREIAKKKGGKEFVKRGRDFQMYGERVFQDIGGFTNDDGSVNMSQALRTLNAGIDVQNKAVGILNKLNPAISKMQDEKNTLTGEISKTLGLDSVAGKDKQEPMAGTGKTTIDKGGIASVNGGGQIRNVTINITNLVSGGVNIETATLKEGVGKAKDIVVEGLLTAVNDANLVGN